MFARVFVLFLGLLGGAASGVLGYQWLGVASTNSDAIATWRGSTDDKAIRGVARVDQLSKASYFLLAAAPLGLVGGVLGGMGKGKLAALLLLLAVPGPVIFTLESLIPTFPLVVGGCLGFFVKAPSTKSEEGLKGCWSAVLGWLNIGGVKVRFQDVNPKVSKTGNAIKGKLQLTTKRSKYVADVNYQFILKRTTGKGKEKETKEHVLGKASQKLNLDLPAGEAKTLDFQLPYSLEKSLKDMGGVLGGIGKLAAFAVGERDEFFLVAEAYVQGSLFEPSHKLKITMVD